MQEKIRENDMKAVKFKDLRMQNKLFLAFLSVILVIMMLILYFSMTVSETSIRTQMLDSIQETTRQMGENIDNVIQGVLDVSTQVCSDETICSVLQEAKPETEEAYYRNDRTVKGILDSSFATEFSVESVFICSYNGSIYAAGKNKLSLIENYDFTRTAWFEDMKISGKNTMILSGYDVNSYITTGEAQKLFSVVKRINEPVTGKEIGCMIVDMNSDILGNVLQSVNSNSYQQALIIDNNKKTIYHPDSKYIGTQYREPQVSQLLSMGDGYLEAGGGKGYFVFNTSRVTGWSILCVVENRYIMDSVNRLRLFLAVVAAFCLVLSVYIARNLSRNISEPVSRLQEQMHRVEEGDFDVDIRAESQDEIGRLTHAFDRMVGRTKELIENVYQSGIYQKEAELNALQAQINPHFLYNTLQTIDMMAEEEGVQEISDACQALSKIFRYSINRGREFVRLREEIVHIRNYMLIQQLRFGNKLEVEYDVEKSCEDLFIVKLLIQPLVENAVVHGIENVLGKCKVQIRVYRADGCLFAEVMDNGNGIEECKLKELNECLQKSSEKKMVHEEEYGGGRSIGLENTNARIKLYFGREYGITIESEEGAGTCVRLRLPIKNEQTGGKEDVRSVSSR